MHLLEQYMIEERTTIMDQNIRVNVIGRRDDIPEAVQREMDKTIDMSASQHRHAAVPGDQLRRPAGDGRRGARDCRAGAAGKLDPRQIDEADDQPSSLYTAGMPDPDLLIRTAGEMRVSNFLLWQISYAEIWVTEHCWPEFRESRSAPGDPRFRRSRSPLRRAERLTRDFSRAARTSIDSHAELDRTPIKEYRTLLRWRLLLGVLLIAALVAWCGSIISPRRPALAVVRWRWSWRLGAASEVVSLLAIGGYDAAARRDLRRDPAGGRQQRRFRCLCCRAADDRRAQRLGWPLLAFTLSAVGRLCRRNAPLSAARRRDRQRGAGRLRRGLRGLLLSFAVQLRMLGQGR